MSAASSGADAVLEVPTRPARAWWIALPAIISVSAFLVIDLLLAALVDRPWGPAYPPSMDALVLLRMGPLFFSGLVVWPAMRARGASRGQALVGIWATPLAFAVISAWRAVDFFPPLEAAYYGTNPIVIGALGAQLSSAGVGALVWGLWRLRRWSWWAVVSIAVGTAATVVAVLWDGGQHLFYPWVLVYGRLFG
ncbi:MAG: hypothetical protein RL347_274 [Actinomycetota bacterium]